MDLTDCGQKFQAIADLCLNDSFPTLEFGLSRVSFMLSLILRRRGTLGFVNKMNVTSVVAKCRLPAKFIG